MKKIIIAALLVIGCGEEQDSCYCANGGYTGESSLEMNNCITPVFEPSVQAVKIEQMKCGETMNVPTNVGGITRNLACDAYGELVGYTLYDFGKCSSFWMVRFYKDQEFGEDLK